MIKGDWSDPGVVRVGEDYYSLRSTFSWQPGLAVAHSKDLVHWAYIGNGFTSLPAIAPGEVANGIWGSEIIYNPNTSMFMLYATYNGLSVFESPTPEGPYTAVPGGLMAEGYDPGVFVDDDGRVYLVSSAGKVVELSADGKTVINPSVSTYAGWNEGPELFKRGDDYYVTWSSNGTERGANGIVNSARATTLAGPWSSDPTNPVLRNLNEGTDPDHPFASRSARTAAGGRPSEDRSASGSTARSISAGVCRRGPARPSASTPSKPGQRPTTTRTSTRSSHKRD